MNGKKEFIVLGLYEVHNASAAIMIDGHVVAAAHEERFSRLKGDHGFPLKAAEFCLAQAGVRPQDVDCVAMLNERFDPNGIANILFKRAALYKIEDWVYENTHYWKPRLIDKKPAGSYFEIMGGKERVSEHYYDLSKFDMSEPPEKVSEAFNEIRRDTVQKYLGIPKERVEFVTHYLCHHYHAYYSSPFRGDDTVVLHSEGDGGLYNCAVSIPTSGGLKIIGGSNQSDLGRLYQWMTLLLGMKPYHHEYKLMGLAPFASLPEIEKSYRVFADIFRLDEEKMAVVYKNRPEDLYWTFRNKLEGHRFDGIAAALQRTVEEHLCQWMSLVLKKTNRSRVCYGGGVAMNVKANMELAGITGVNDFFVPLSPADESNVMGAAYMLTEKKFLEDGRNPEDIPRLQSPYLGKEYGQEDSLSALQRARAGGAFQVREKVDNGDIAALLAEGLVVSVCRGKSEFGQRSLGNRSILAHPGKSGIVERINSQIKYRDFWMPFCPSVLDVNSTEYIENPLGLASDYMTLAFPVKRDQIDNIRNTVHPGDNTARPQILKKDTNPAYFDMIEKFRTKTGLGILLNTSFNLHGEPVVDSPDDAMSTFMRSNLDAVVIGDSLISRNSEVDNILPGR